MGGGYVLADGSLVSVVRIAGGHERRKIPREPGRQWAVVDSLLDGLRSDTVLSGRAVNAEGQPWHPPGRGPFTQSPRPVAGTMLLSVQRPEPPTTGAVRSCLNGELANRTPAAESSRIRPNAESG